MREKIKDSIVVILTLGALPYLGYCILAGHATWHWLIDATTNCELTNTDVVCSGFPEWLAFIIGLGVTSLMIYAGWMIINKLGE